ncbi:ImmA/IrrE family metallo-endopeptidase [Acetobacter fallax]|uniref:ImmA/IrrE family metallo-endopeptidase n=2 Tax=Acetobacter fallax TaxID=1737473 RepID=A0ABX0KCQ2_9PROT|nr:ImmA/IrrE family metallo-endopeptidase [Acetobacter fallax]NHO32831.1 ImmA/IrrE family metallo-endopeptidase [Acetobacter fallax]NHO36385.1 ImmA/IrrE family metallo-endopeptidase [Acetobacter fallax]
MSDFDLPIGHLQSRDSDGAVVNGGSVSGLSFAILWDIHRSTGEAYGHLTVKLANEIVWRVLAEESSIDLMPFLAFLSAKWDALVFNQGYPGGKSLIKPSAILQTRSFFSLDEEAAEEDDDNNDVFLSVHDLSHGFRDVADWPSLWFVKEDSLAVLEANQSVVRWPFYDVIRTLERLGTLISNRIKEIDANHDLVVQWEKRNNLSIDEILPISLGLPKGEVETLIRTNVIERPGSRSELVRDFDETRAAARMLGSVVDLDDLVLTISALREIPKTSTPELDALSLEAEDALAQFTLKEPFHQGRYLATWLREKIGLDSEGSCVELEHLLKQWGVFFGKFETASNVEAISVWGDKYGPGVLINSVGTRSRDTTNNGAQNFGARATMAHEICHLLIDRGTTLSVLEVYGGATPKIVEQRANAFAAEFLLPMDWAIRLYRNSPDVSSALNIAKEQYQTTRTLSAAQMLNYDRKNPGSLHFFDKKHLSHIASTWR